MKEKAKEKKALIQRKFLYFACKSFVAKCQGKYSHLNFLWITSILNLNAIN